MEYDPLFKFYILASFIVVNAMGIILLLTEQQLSRVSTKLNLQPVVFFMSGYGSLTFAVL